MHSDAGGVFPSVGPKDDTWRPTEMFHSSQFCHHKNNQRGRKQVSVIAQQVLIMGWQVFVPRRRQQAAFLTVCHTEEEVQGTK